MPKKFLKVFAIIWCFIVNIQTSNIQDSMCEIIKASIDNQIVTPMKISNNNTPIMTQINNMNISNKST